MASVKGVAQCRVTFACLGASLEKLNTKQEAVSGAVQREGERLNKERAGYKVEQTSVTNIYRTKFERVREDMAVIARSARLRQRALRLQEEYQR